MQWMLLGACGAPETGVIVMEERGDRMSAFHANPFTARKRNPLHARPLQKTLNALRDRIDTKIKHAPKRTGWSEAEIERKISVRTRNAPRLDLALPVRPLPPAPSFFASLLYIRSA
jgi:hypothetical protein